MVQPVTIDTISKNLLADRFWRERRHPQWTTNYELYRDTVIINRLTQRQSVNVPYMKKTIKTYLTQTNWPVDNTYESKSNNKQAELYLNAYWQECVDRLRLDILEEVDRKQEWLYGRTFMKLNILDGWFHMEVIDPQDVLVDRYVNPWDLQSAKRITHVGIYRSLSDIARNPLYDKAAVAELYKFFATKAGLIVAGQNAAIVADRAQRMSDMGVPDVLMPILGETYVELNEQQIKLWDPTDEREVVTVVVTGQANQILMQKPLEEILGINMFTWASWGGDTERTDFWSDGGADSVRGLNLVANARWSQKVENGTLANFGMYFYDSTAKEGWTPTGYDPAPFGFYPLPGPPKEVMSPVQIEQMPDIYNELNFIDEEIQGVSGASAVESGDTDPNDGGGAQTAQEIQILAQKAQDRAKNISKYHKRYWEDIGNIFVALLMANGESMTPAKLHKKSQKGKYYAKTLNLKQTYSKDGYKVKVGSKADKEADALQMVQKLQVATAQFPQNVPLQKIQKQQTLDWLDLTPEQKKEVMDFDDQNPGAGITVNPGGGPPKPNALPGAPPGGPPNPGSPVPLQIPSKLPQPVAS